MSKTLEAAYEETSEYRWKGMRSYKRNRCQVRIAIDTLTDIAWVPPRPGCRAEGEPIRSGRFEFPVYFAGPEPLKLLTVADITKAHLRAAVKRWQAEGTSSPTIVARLNCLSAMGVNVNGCRPRVARKLKWYLNAEAEAMLLVHLRMLETPTMSLLADFVAFQTRVGLRVEEVLRLRWTDIHTRDGRTFISVSGSKTAFAQKTLPIAEDAAALLSDRRSRAGTTGLVFDVSYRTVQHAWKEARMHLGLPDPTVATLKALRRSAARHLTMKGMPLPLLKDYLRHSCLETTMGYLRLAGGFHENELAKWL